MLSKQSQLDSIIPSVLTGGREKGKDTELGAGFDLPEPERLALSEQESAARETLRDARSSVLSLSGEGYR